MKRREDHGLLLMWLWLRGRDAPRVPVANKIAVALYIGFIVFLLFLGVVLNMQAGARH